MENKVKIIGTSSMLSNSASNQSTLSSAGKEVTDKDIDKMYREDVKAMNGDLMFAAGYKMAVLRMEHFKSSPASTEQPNQQGGEVKSLQECKDEVGRKYLYKDWDDCISGFNSPEGLSIIGKRYDEACGIYCRQFKTTATPVKEIPILSSEDIKLRADKYMKACVCSTSEYVGYVTGADWANKWYKSQLNEKP